MGESTRDHALLSHNSGKQLKWTAATPTGDNQKSEVTAAQPVHSSQQPACLSLPGKTPSVLPTGQELSLVAPAGKWKAPHRSHNQTVNKKKERDKWNERLQCSLKYLFCSDKPYVTTWLKFRDKNFFCRCIFTRQFDGPTLNNLGCLTVTQHLSKLQL